MNPLIQLLHCRYQDVLEDVLHVMRHCTQRHLVATVCPAARCLPKVKVMLARGARARLQMSVLERRVSNLETRRQRAVTEGRLTTASLLQNQEAVVRGVQHVYSVYCLNKLSLVDQMLQEISDTVNVVLQQMA